MESTQFMNQQRIPILDLGAQFQPLRSEILAAVEQVLDAQQFILGPNVAALEREVAAYCGVAEAIGVASGTDALLLSLSAAGVRAGDEVIVPAFSFVATADVVSLLGATPVFADVDPSNLNLCVASARAKLTSRTKAIIPVHLYGRPADMDGVLALAAEHRVAVIEDCAQSLGATIGERRTGSLGDFGCISFFPSKNLGACGDGGMILTNDQPSAERLRMLRSHGSRRKYYSEVQGWNSRLDELQAAILRVKLPHLEEWNRKRRANAEHYGALLRDVDGVALLTDRAGSDSVYHQYTIRVEDRDAVQKYLECAGIQTFIYYPVPLHLQQMYESLGYHPGDMPCSEQAAKEVLSLPMYPELSNEQIEYVAAHLRAAVITARAERESAATRLAS